MAHEWGSIFLPPWGIAAAAVLCIFAAALAYDPGGTADPAPLKDPSVKDGEMLRALGEAAKMYRNGGQDAKAGEQEDMFQNKLAEVASRLLDVEVSSVYADLFFPGPLDPTRHPGQICGSASDIPVHLAKVRDVERYGMFMEKYSAYPIEMHLNDERPFGFHYGFVAMSGDGWYASTFFHVDPCTDVVTDSAGYLLTCHDEESGYFFSTTNQDDINASLKLGDFCVIPISPWRQAFYDYAKEASEETHRHFMGGGPVDDYEALNGILARGGTAGRVDGFGVRGSVRQLCRRCHPRKDPRVPRCLRCPPRRISEAARESGRRMSPLFGHGGCQLLAAHVGQRT